MRRVPEGDRDAIHNERHDILSVGYGQVESEPSVLALGIGGLPRGRVVEVYGPESSGKSTLAMHVVAEAQRNGGVCAYGDAEHVLPTPGNGVGNRHRWISASLGWAPPWRLFGGQWRSTSRGGPRRWGSNSSGG